MRTRAWKALSLTGALVLAMTGPVMAAGGPPDGAGGGSGGGGETETASNHLSYPLIWSEADYTPAFLVDGLTPSFDGATAACTATELSGSTAALQQDLKNLWQADSALVPGNYVTTVDWGDSLESTDANPQKQRVETSLYATITAGMLADDPAATTMTGYPMCQTSTETGANEMWGTILGEPTYENPDALVYTAGARLTIQRIVPGRDYAWDTATHQWTGCGADAPVTNAAIHEATGDGPGTLGVEVTISGKVTYGYNWDTSTLPNGEYRLTFSLDGPTGDFPGSGTSLANASILTSTETAALPQMRAEDGGSGGEGNGNTAVLLGSQNLTYIDVGVGTRTDAVPSCTTPPADTSTGGTTGGATGGTSGAVPTPQAQVAQQGPAQTVVPSAATAGTAQTARIRAKASGRYPVGTVIMLARKAVKTSAGVTVRWRATTQSRSVCTVRTAAGRATATLTRPGICTVVAWAPAPSPDYLPFRTQRTYRAVR